MKEEFSIRTLVYKVIGFTELHLVMFDASVANPERTLVPCVLLIHGGGWDRGKPSDYFFLAESFSRMGLAVACLQYRLVDRSQVSGNTVFECVKDGRSAMRYLRSHASSLGIDPGRIIVCGGSAGGHVAVGTALFDEINEEGENASISPLPSALVLFNPVLDTSVKGYGNAKIGVRWEEISPLARVKTDMPPTIIFHGTADRIAPFSGTKRFHQLMFLAGNFCELHPAEGQDHGYYKEALFFMDVIRRVEVFLASIGLKIVRP